MAPTSAPGCGGAIGDRSVYVHLDCDVLEPGLVPTEYRVPGGLSLHELTQACATLAEHGVLGAEIAEFEDDWPNGETDDGRSVIEAIEPLLRRFRRLPAPGTR